MATNDGVTIRQSIAASARAGSLAVSGSLVFAMACGGDKSSPTGPTPTVTVPPVTVTAVTITGTATLTTIGESAQLAAAVDFSNGSTQDQTNAIQWQSSDPLVASVTTGGLVTATGGGTTSVRATYQQVTGVKQVQVLPGPPVASSNAAGRIDNLQTAADLIAYHQDAVGWSAFRIAGTIARWDLPVRVYVAPAVSVSNVEQALAYWRSVTGLPSVLSTTDTEPRVLVRAGTDGLFAGAEARGGIDATYQNNRARSGLVEIRPDLAACDFSQPSCAVLYERVFGGALGLFGQVPGGITSSASRASLREINTLVELYRLPHGVHVEPDGTWTVVR
jgi:hypothetical protein